MYDETFTTADSAQLWLYFEGKLREKSMIMADRFLQDYSRVWTVGRDDRPPDSLHNEFCAIERREKKDASSITIPGFQFQMDENGALTIIQTGSHYLLVSSNETQAFRDAVMAVIPAADPVPLDLNTTPPMFPVTGQTSAPPHVQQSMKQNELAALALKAKRR
jgi:hypothetical protein